ncbi:integrase [Adhaeribacter arboris]|uniref:Integrase n=1 Tax=Adhaeribacter arboris TaxID=2072846 RepID=A0A2T2YMC5_9BACT|nr:site-specific integrase [Adhaeribacter arboris]PSR56649.1 integrase [Adhaeribacter arboris]
MSTVKLVLRKKPNKEGKFPLCLRITKDRKSSFIHLGYHLNEDDWDDAKQRVKKSHPNATRFNNLLLKKLAEANDKTLELETLKTNVSSQAVKQRVKPAQGLTFFVQAQAYLDNLKASGKYNQYTADKPRIKHFREFVGNQDLAFSDITVALLERFKVYLRGKYQISERTIVNHLAAIRSVFSKAIREQIVERKNSPFGSERIQIKFPDTVKIGLSSDELKRLEEVKLDNPLHNHARNMWLFSYYFAGMRVSDVLRLKWADFQNDRLHYSMGKNTKAGSLKTHERALAIMAQYADEKRHKDDFIFPELKKLDNLNDKFALQRTIAFTTSRIDKFLRNHVASAIQTDKKLTMHLARHTFAQIAGDKISIQILQKLYRHSSITTTLGYQSNFTIKHTDDALDAVIGT